LRAAGQAGARLKPAASTMSIFVSIASYCDPVLPFTLRRALATARWPERLHFGVVDQNPRPLAAGGSAQAHAVIAALAPARLTYLRLDPVYARGPCWARSVAMGLYDGEDWFFQIDSHMDFDAHWDERFIAQAQALCPGRPGLVLSAYPDAFVFDQGQPVRTPTTGPVVANVVAPGTAFAADHLVLKFLGRRVRRAEVVPGFCLGAGCLFAPGAFALRFPYDPAFYFHGEEQALALRLFTHGWDIFHMPLPPAYHLYNNGRSGGPSRPLHWDKALDRQRSETWWQLEQRSRRRLAALVAGEPLGVYGLGQARSLAAYAAFSGIDYTARTLAPQAYRPIGVADEPVPCLACPLP
jgi:hypothetical protein